MEKWRDRGRKEERQEERERKVEKEKAFEKERRPAVKSRTIETRVSIEVRLKAKLIRTRASICRSVNANLRPIVNNLHLCRSRFGISAR